MELQRRHYAREACRTAIILRALLSTIGIDAVRAASFAERRRSRSCKLEQILSLRKMTSSCSDSPKSGLGLGAELSLGLGTEMSAENSSNSGASSQQKKLSSEKFSGWAKQIVKGAIDVNQIPASSESERDMEESQFPVLRLFDGSCLLKLDRAEAAHPEKLWEASSRESDEEDGAGPRKKLRLSKEQSALLEESFKEHSTLNPKQKSVLAKQLNLRPRQVEVWFQNRRARTKLKQTEVDCELFKRCCEALTKENRRLQKEVQELRAIKMAAPCVIPRDLYTQLPAVATLSMCPSCERGAALASTADRSRSPSSLFSAISNTHNQQQQQAC